LFYVVQRPVKGVDLVNKPSPARDGAAHAVLPLFFCDGLDSSTSSIAIAEEEGT